MKVDDEVYIHSGLNRHQRATIVTMLPKMMTVHLLTGRKKGKVVRVNQTSAVVVEAQYRTNRAGAADVVAQPVVAEAQPVVVVQPYSMGTNLSPVEAIMGRINQTSAVHDSRVVEPDIQGDTVQRAREEVATPAEIMDMIQEDMFDVQLMNGLMTQRMNRMIQLLERLKLEQPRQA